MHLTTALEIVAALNQEAYDADPHAGIAIRFQGTELGVAIIASEVGLDDEEDSTLDSCRQRLVDHAHAILRAFEPRAMGRGTGSGTGAP